MDHESQSFDIAPPSIPRRGRVDRCESSAKHPACRSPTSVCLRRASSLLRSISDSPRSLPTIGSTAIKIDHAIGRADRGTACKCGSTHAVPASATARPTCPLQCPTPVAAIVNRSAESNGVSPHRGARRGDDANHQKQSKGRIIVITLSFSFFAIVYTSRFCIVIGGTRDGSLQKVGGPFLYILAAISIGFTLRSWPSPIAPAWSCPARWMMRECGSTNASPQCIGRVRFRRASPSAVSSQGWGTFPPRLVGQSSAAHAPREKHTTAVSAPTPTR